MKFKYCIRSMRLRTLPLSLAGIVLGVLLAAADYHINVLSMVFLILTAVSLQILSNLSNELGDALSGTDTEVRQGMRYSIQDGGLTTGQMQVLIASAVAASVFFGLFMIWTSFDSLFSLPSLVMMFLGFLAIRAAMHYTLGSNPYGYRGLGDLFVFMFFGMATVVGGYYVCTHEISSWTILLPAAAIGCFSVAVLNVNNIRDMKTDAATRVTVAMKLGPKRARIYQTALIVLGWVFMTAYALTRIPDIWHYLYVLTLPLFVLHLRGVWIREDPALDPMLPLLVMSSFLFALLGGLGFVIYLF